MISHNFQQIIESGQGGAVLCAGSDSDAPHIAKIITSLESFKIPHVTHICSAHKQPIELMALIDAYNQVEGSLAFIAIAGMTDALSGLLSYHALAPVISCPPNGYNESCLTNPPGSSNATIIHPKNAGRFVAQMFAAVNPSIRAELLRQKQKKLLSLAEADRQFRS